MKRYEVAYVDHPNIGHKSETRVTRTVRVPIRGYAYSAPDDYVPDPDHPYGEEAIAFVRLSSYGEPHENPEPVLFIACDYSIGATLSKAINEAIPLAWAEWEKAFGTR